MTKLVKLKFDEGNFEVGFKVTVQIGEDGKLYDTEFEGRLPSAPTIPPDYQEWRTNYLTLDKSWCGPVSGKGGNKKGETIQLVQLAKESAESFHSNFINWLNSTDDKAFQFFKSKLYQKLGKKSTEIRVVIQTDNPLLKKLPWHEWDLFTKYYTNAEVAIGATAFDKPISHVTSKQLKILAILGNSEGIKTEEDRKTLESLKSSEVFINFLVQPKGTEISDSLWKDNWNILFFAGHSSSEGEKGRIFINNTDSLTIEELKNGLIEAIKCGLQLAIFNSCDGLKLAEDLADLNIPQVIFMREPVIDKVAHAFLKYFLEQFSQDDSLYLAVRHARERLIKIGYDNDFPGSRWLPVIFQNPTVTPPTWTELKGFPTNPYRALSPFREEDSEYFFGRENIIVRLQKIVEKQNFVMVLGASGSGKSSVVYAGLVPYLRQQKQWRIAQFRPQSKPFSQLAQALVPLLHPDKQTQNQEFTPFAKALYEGQKNLSQTVRDIAKIHANQQFLLIVDQFEELYTSNPIEVQHRFIDQLLQIVDAISQQNAWENLPKFTLLITLRADFLGKVLAYAPFAEMSNKYSDIKMGPMGENGLKAAIENPAEKQGVTIDAGLTERILQDLGQAPGNLSLLEFALAQLWKSMNGGIITHKDYDAIGGVKQAIAQYANDFYDTLTPREQATLRRIMVQLVRPGEGTDDARQVAIRSQIGEENWHLVIHLADARLVVTGQDKDTKQDTVELIHEALIHHWQLLKDWMNENRDALRTKRDIETAAKEWEAYNKSKGSFLKNPKLNTAQDYLTRYANKVPLSNLAQEFVHKSIEYRNKKLFIWIGVVAVAFLMLGGTAFYAYEQRILADKQTEIARQNEKEAKESAKILLIEKLGAQSVLATQSPNVSNGYYEQALLLAIQAFNEKDIVTSRSNLLRVLQAKKQQNIFLYGHSKSVIGMVFSPDGQTLASWSDDNTVRLWDVQTRQPLGDPLVGHSSWISRVAFNPDGQTLALGGDTLRLWDVQTRQPLGDPLVGHSNDVYSVAFNLDGKTLASGSRDNTVILWDVKTRQPLGKALVGHSKPVYSVAFSPDGQTLVSGSEDNTMRLWDVKTRQPLGDPLVSHSEIVLSVAFSPDGQTLVSGSYDNTVRLWNVETRQPLGDPLVGHPDVAFSPDGQTLALWGSDNTVRLWNVQTRQLFGEPLVGHFESIISMAFSPDGQFIVSGSWDKTVRLWNVQTRQPLVKALIGHSDKVTSVAFSPDGQSLALGSTDNTVRLWNVQTKQPLGEPLVGHSDKVTSVAFSPDDQTLASGSDDKTVRLWNVQTRQPLGDPLVGHHFDVESVTFSPDGKTLASGSGDMTVILWDVQMRQPLGELLVGLLDSVTFSPDGKTLASGSGDMTVKLWDVQTRQPLGAPLVGHSQSVKGVAFSPDGKTLASGSNDNTVRLWDVKTRQPLGDPLVGHSTWVNSVAFSSDGQTLASGSGDMTVILWDVQTRQPLGDPLVGHSDVVSSVTFSPDGQTLASGSWDNSVILWDVNPESWMTQACAIVNRNFSREEWQQYMGKHRPHEKTCPNLPKDTLGAIELTQQARQLLKEGKKEQAKAKFAQAKKWDKNVIFGDEEFEPD